MRACICVYTCIHAYAKSRIYTPTPTSLKDPTFDIDIYYCQRPKNGLGVYTSAYYFRFFAEIAGYLFIC